MLLLASTSDKIQVVTGGAVTVDVHASYIDYDGAIATPGRKNTAITTAATTDVVLSPTTGVYRNVKFMTVANKHASSSVLVTIQHTDGTNVIEIRKLTLLAGERLEFIEGQGFLLYGANGALKSVLANVITQKLAADQSNSTITATELTGLTIACPAGTYVFQYFILYQSSVATTGVKFSVNHTGTVSAMVGNWYATDISATAATATANQVVVGTAGQLFSVFPFRAKSTAGVGVLLGVDLANTDMLAIVEGLVIVTADGNIALWHGSETAAATTVKAGSSLVLIKTG